MACGNAPTDAAFYAVRSRLLSSNAETDIKKAMALDKDQWRYYKLLTDFYFSSGQNEKAVGLAEQFYRLHTDNYIIGMLYAKALLATGRYGQCDTLLSAINIIPFEGATEGRVMYRESKLQQALSLMKAGQYKKALPFIKAAQQWPVNLGAGQPYEEDIDTRLENWMSFLCLSGTNNATDANACLRRIIAFIPQIDNTVSNFYPANHLVTAWALEKTKGRQNARDWLDKEVKLSPDNPILQWCKAAFKDQWISTPANIAILEALMKKK